MDQEPHSTTLLNVLVIDDEPDDSAIITRFLESIREWKIKAFAAHSAEAAATELQARSIDVVVLDYLLGSKTGLEWLEEFRSTGDQRPVIAVTGQGDEHVAAEISRAGADEYLIKDELDAESLRRAIHSALQRFQIRQSKKAELDRKLQQAERLATIGQTIASVSHNIKGIMTALKGSAYLIEQALEKQDHDSIGRLWQIYKRNNERLSYLVEAMLDYSRDTTLSLEAVSLSELVEDVRQTYQAAAESNGVIIRTVTPKELPPIQIDREAIHATLQGIVENAIQALTKYGGGDILMRTLDDPDRRLQAVQIRDNGPGIPPEILEKVFDPFFTTKGSQGTGLGLAIAHKSVMAHGGRIELDSRPGRTAFTVWLPVNTTTIQQDSERQDRLAG